MDFVFDFKQIFPTMWNSIYIDMTLAMFCNGDFENLFLDFREN